MINFLLTTEIIPLCLRIMEQGSELSKTVATFILQKILLDETGLYYICQTYDRFSHVAMILVRKTQHNTNAASHFIRHDDTASTGDVFVHCRSRRVDNKNPLIPDKRLSMCAIVRGLGRNGFISSSTDAFAPRPFLFPPQGKMVIALSKEPSARLLKHVVRCYLRLTDNQRACEALCQCLPDQLKDDTFNECLKDDKSTKHWLATLLKNLDNMNTQQQQPGKQLWGGLTAHCKQQQHVLTNDLVTFAFRPLGVCGKSKCSQK